MSRVGFICNCINNYNYGVIVTVISDINVIVIDISYNCVIDTGTFNYYSITFQVQQPPQMKNRTIQSFANVCELLNLCVHGHVINSMK